MEDEPYIGSIEMWAGTFAPYGWAFCNGQIISISQNEALYSLLGTTFGGDGVNTFALPDLRGRIPVGTSSTIALGAAGGSETLTLGAQQAGVTVLTAKLPATAFSDSGTARAIVTDKGGADITTTPQVLGAGQPHDNLQPYLSVNYVIALYGVFPSRP
jgi:microcystin-dependent protein